MGALLFIVLFGSAAIGLLLWGGAGVVSTTDRATPPPPAALADRGLRQDELVRIEGNVAIDDTLLRSPIEGRPCVGYYLGVDYFDGSRHHVPQWFPVTEETVVVPFRVIGDDGSVVEIDANRFDIELHFVEGGRVLDPPADRVRPVLRRDGATRFADGRNLAYVEVVIEPGARVSLVGRVLRPASAGGGAYRSSTRGAALGPLGAEAPIRLDLAS